LEEVLHLLIIQLKVRNPYLFEEDNIPVWLAKLMDSVPVLKEPMNRSTEWTMADELRDIYQGLEPELAKVIHELGPKCRGPELWQQFLQFIAGEDG
jgi:hypothetical protein